MSLRSTSHAGRLAVAALLLVTPTVVAAQHRETYERDLASTLNDMRTRREQWNRMTRMESSMRDAVFGSRNAPTRSYSSPVPANMRPEAVAPVRHTLSTAEVFDETRAAAARGDAAARVKLGHIYATGYAGTKDLAAAYRAYSAAAAQGDVDGETWRAILLLRGDGVARDSAAGIAGLRRAVTRGNATAQEWLDAYAPVPVDPGERAGFFRRAADKGDVNGMLWMADLYERGDGVLQSDSLSTVWYERAAARGSQNAQLELASRWDRGTHGFARDEARADRIYRELAAGGHPQAMARIGYQYLRGAPGTAVDTAQALAWFERAVAAGEARGTYEAGQLYRDGWSKGTRDPVKARRLFEQGEAMGYGPSANELAVAWLNGIGGPADDATAVRHLMRAAELGFAPAAGDLGGLYVEGGAGVTPDRARALRWYTQAALLADKPAQVARYRAKVVALGGDGVALDAARARNAGAKTAGRAAAKGTAADL